jgi:hypothetical protein
MATTTMDTATPSSTRVASDQEDWMSPPVTAPGPLPAGSAGVGTTVVEPELGEAGGLVDADLDGDALALCRTGLGDAEADLLVDGEADGDLLGEAEVEADADALADDDGLAEADLLADADALADGDLLGDGECDLLGEALGLVGEAHTTVTLALPELNTVPPAALNTE